jgi:hypothetical protein
MAIILVSVFLWFPATIAFFSLRPDRDIYTFALTGFFVLLGGGAILMCGAGAIAGLFAAAKGASFYAIYYYYETLRVFRLAWRHHKLLGALALSMGLLVLPLATYVVGFYSSKFAVAAIVDISANMKEDSKACAIVEQTGERISCGFIFKYRGGHPNQFGRWRCDPVIAMFQNVIEIIILVIIYLTPICLVIFFVILTIMLSKTMLLRLGAEFVRLSKLCKELSVTFGVLGGCMGVIMQLVFHG